MPEQASFVLSPGHSPTEPCLTPRDLWEAVLRARSSLARERQLHARHLDPTARLALLDALERYVNSLGERGHPVPYALRDELRLLQLTGAAGRRVISRTT